MDFGINQGLVEELYLRFRENPSAVDGDWRKYFERLTEAEQAGLMRRGEPAAGPVYGSNGNGHGVTHGQNGQNGQAKNGHTNGAGNGHRAAEFSTTVTGGYGLSNGDLQQEYQERVTALVNGYRLRGHRFAQLDPLGINKPEDNELSLARFGLDQVDPNTLFATGNFAGPAKLPLKEFVKRLQQTYCRSIGVEYRNIEEPEIRAWLQERMETTQNRIELTHQEQVRILSKLIDAEIFEQFLHTKYVGAKRFSLEGSESIIPLLELVIDSCGQHRLEEIVIGMAHRGRLNVLVNVMEKSLKEIFAAFEDDNPEPLFGRGDVKYHLGYSSDRVMPDGHNIHLTLAFNPSHLEFVNPVVEGRVRAKQDRRGDRERKKVLPLLIHGDAAFIGQGVVAETLNLSGLRGYSSGGTVHVVINNQIGFTTVWNDSRSSRYCTDLTRMLRCPVFHVNGEDPEAVAQVVRLSMDYRQRFGRDVVIDMYGYRRYGHNEADEPRFTQPMMYSAVDQKPSVREVYVQRLIEGGRFTREQAGELEAARRRFLEAELENVRKGGPFMPPQYAMQGLWAGYKGGPDADCPDVPTNVPKEKLKELLTKITETPPDFHVHPKLKRFLDQRRDQRDEKRPLDWGTGESLAYASLVMEGWPVRLSGQDSRRGTFTHRHAVLHDTQNGKLYTPLAKMDPKQARFEVWDSPLSEAGVLGFEYGISLDYPDALVIWEAQFGDFANGAQVLIDQFLSSSEDKWYRLSGLVLLLPHGFEGQGPEHSSARLERFLTLCAEDNMQVCNLTTPAQCFHALRRQVLRPYRKPLVIMSPKSLLRSPAAVSTLEDLATGGFQCIIPDQGKLDPKKVKKVLLCSGKVYYDLAAAREERKRDDVAIVRVEQLYPLRKGEIESVLAPYKASTQVVWVQEEPWNMGAWYYIRARLPDRLGNSFPLTCVSRAESASPATGSLSTHKIEQQLLVDQAFGD
ncbi:MAG TPA: 2-oxoglutarate dehydrogenase E1 component [Polyangiales bacterium]|nr:2-oxoglutarate dehydrogenase E1 component [Polyangiales bacterium]